MGRQRRKRGSGSVLKDRQTGQYIARTADRTRSARFATRQEAEKALLEWNQLAADGFNLTDMRQSVQVFLTRWLEHKRVGKKVKSSTLTSYTRSCNYMIPYIGKIAICDLNALHIQQMLDALQSELAPRSVHHVRSVLRNALNTARKWKLLRDNPAMDVEVQKVERQKDKALDPVEIVALLNATAGHRLDALYHLTLALGLRRGEILGLRWIDVDWEAGTLEIAQQVSPGEHGRAEIVPYLKNDSSRRTLPLTDDLVARLQAHWSNQQEERMTARRREDNEEKTTGQRPIHWQEYGLIFPSERGTPLYPCAFSSTHFKRMLRKAGLSDEICFHDLRHTALTDLAAVAEAKAVQSIAGHSDIQTTMNLYAGRRIDAMRKAVEQMEEKRRTG
jgi:integrase